MHSLHLPDPVDTHHELPYLRMSRLSFSTLRRHPSRIMTREKDDSMWIGTSVLTLGCFHPFTVGVCSFTSTQERWGGIRATCLTYTQFHPFRAMNPHGLSSRPRGYRTILPPIPSSSAVGNTQNPTKRKTIISVHCAACSKKKNDRRNAQPTQPDPTLHPPPPPTHPPPEKKQKIDNDESTYRIDNV